MDPPALNKAISTPSKHSAVSSSTACSPPVDSRPISGSPLHTAHRNSRDRLSPSLPQHRRRQIWGRRFHRVPVHHDTTKHVANKIHIIRDIVDFGLIKIHKIHTTLNSADMLTKGLPGNAFEKYLVTLGVTTWSRQNVLHDGSVVYPSHQWSTWKDREQKS